MLHLPTQISSKHIKRLVETKFAPHMSNQNAQKVMRWMIVWEKIDALSTSIAGTT